MNEAENFLDALSRLSNEDLGRILKNIIDYAENVLDSFGFIPRSETDSSSGEDFAQEAFKRAIEGKRKWDKESHPDIAEFLRMVVFSLIRNHLKKSKKSPVLIKDFETEQFEDDEQYSELAGNSSLEVEVTAEQWARLEQAFGEDADGYIFFTDWLENMAPGNIAKNYGVEVDVVYRKLKKGKAIVKKLFSK